MAGEEPLLDVAAALADGKSVDWDSAARSVRTDEERRLLAELRFIAGVTQSTPPAATSRTPSPARTWGPLEIIERVGHGTFGDVYRAWDTRLDREVALKILRQQDRGDHVSAAIEEGRLLARVRHPNVVTVYGAERVNGEIGVWMEFVDGTTLEEELRAHGPLAVDRVIRIGIELAGALSTVHRAGLIHRDVKAQNILSCASDGRLVLTDFGAGCQLDEGTHEQAGELAGTPVCAAPEVIEGEAATPQSDVYSLGVLLYHLLTGSYPVLGRSLKDVREAHALGTRTSLAAARPDLPNALARIVDRALEPSPARRYEDADALGAALASLVQPAVDERAAVASGPRRMWPSIAVGIVLAVAAVFGAAGLWWMSETPTIAVLPFENLSADPDSEYFVDGLTDEIIRSLSVIEGLDVRSRTSSFTFKDKPRNVREVGAQLHANLVVEGSVLRSDGRLRVNAQLVRAADDTPLWSGRFDRELKDVFAIQEEISRSIVNELRLKLGAGQRRYDTNVEAYDLYLKARSQVRLGSPSPARAAVDLFEEVIAMDPAFAPAYAGLADAWAAMSVNRVDSAARPDEALDLMKPAVERALQLDPLLAEAHAALGIVLTRDRRWAEAEAAFRHAIELNGSISSIYVNFVMSALWPQGKVDESVRQLRAALRRDPLSVDVQARLANVLVSAGRYEESIELGRRLVISAPAADDGLNHARQVLARALLQHGERVEAVNRFEQLGIGSAGFRGHAYAVTGRPADARAEAAQRADFPAALALIHAGLGENERAFEALERMAAEHDPRVGIYLTYPELASLRADSRMTAFRRKLGLP